MKMHLRKRKKSIASEIFRRFGRFSVVGAGGILVQTATLAALLRFSGIHYMLATALAVELSVIHNFIWHQRWTWADRQQTRPALVLLRFNATNGVMSMAGNIFFMWVFVAGFSIEPHAANLMTIGLCSLVNFALADRFVFV